MRRLSLLPLLLAHLLVQAAGPALPNPVLFVTQVPQPADFTTVTALFGNHRGSMDSAPRGGDLWIRYPDGTLKNLTKAAGFGVAGAQHTNGIAVREPAVHWSGEKALFSMVVGAPTRRYEVKDFFWQLYEVTNFLDPAATPVITKVPNQPANYNNVAPCYGTDDRIIFASDRPRSGERHLWPQLDEYEEAPVVSGLWSLDAATGDLFLLNHSPSGAFSPSVDSFGRVVFIRWDHLQRDQQADADAGSGGTAYGTFNYSSEAADATALFQTRPEIFPEARQTASTVNGHTFNDFFPWMINEDGTDEETLNHLGRHELGGSYRSASFNDDPNVGELYYFGNKFNTNVFNNFIHLRESPTEPGRYFGTDAPEFGTHSAGQIVALNAHARTNADFCRLDYVTHRDTASFTDTPAATHTGLYRNPLPLSDGRLAAIHTPETRGDRNEGTGTAPRSRYDFRLKLLKQEGTYWQADAPLTPGLSNSVSWWSPDELVTYNGPLWELDPVEVRPRLRPARLVAHVDVPERKIFAEEGVELSALARYLRERNLALIIGRNATTRDAGDFQQPFNLRVPGGTQSLGKPGKIYDIAHLQLYQADLIRGIGMRQSTDTPRAGRRVLAQRMHDPAVDNPPNAGGPQSSVPLAADGSFASFVPARRSMSWQLTAPDGTPVVRERYWVTFQPGEVRTCGSCHGVNTRDQAGRAAPTNSPEALRGLLRHWKNQSGYARLAAHPEAQRVRLTVSAGPGRTNVIESSPDLLNWTPVTTNQPNTTGQFPFTVPLSADAEPRFYRVRVK